MKFSIFEAFHRHGAESVRDVYDYHLELTELTEELGFHGVWLAEHHFSEYGMVPAIFGMLARLADRTETIRLGSGVIVLPLHQPVQVAEEVAQVDILSGGRVDFGVGRGYLRRDFDSFAISFGEARERFWESLELILQLWTRESGRYEGQFYRTGDVMLSPRPVQDPHPPVYVAAQSEQTIQACAARGLWTLTDCALDFGKVAGAVGAWRATAAAHGHDVAAADLVVSRTVCVSAADAARAAPEWPRLDTFGEPEPVITQVRQLAGIGVTNVMCDFDCGRHISLDEMRQAMKFLAAEVFPAVA